MKIIYYLKNCNTCVRILKEINLSDQFTLREIKSNPITSTEVEKMKDIIGSYQALFNKRSKLYSQYNLKEKKIDEKDYKKYLLQHYTFLKRPVILYRKKIYIGNSFKTVESFKQDFNE